MCYSKESSIVSYTISSIASILLFIYGDIYDKNIALFCFTFVQMQLIEYFIWIDQKCGKINDIASRFINLELHLQPFSVILGMLLYNTSTLSKEILYILFFILIINILVSIYINFSPFRKRRNQCSKPSSNSLLEWDMGDNIMNKYFYYFKLNYIYYFGIMFIPWLFLKNKTKGLLLFLINGFFLLYNLKFDIHKYSVELLKSGWCFSAVLIPVIFLIKLLFS